MRIPLCVRLAVEADGLALPDGHDRHVARGAYVDRREERARAVVQVRDLVGARGLLLEEKPRLTKQRGGAFVALPLCELLEEARDCARRYPKIDLVRVNDGEARSEHVSLDCIDFELASIAHGTSAAHG